MALHLWRNYRGFLEEDCCWRTDKIETQPIIGGTNLFMQSCFFLLKKKKQTRFNLSHASTAPCYAHFSSRQTFYFLSQSATTELSTTGFIKMSSTGLAISTSHRGDRSDSNMRKTVKWAIIKVWMDFVKRNKGGEDVSNLEASGGRRDISWALEELEMCNRHRLGGENSLHIHRAGEGRACSKQRIIQRDHVWVCSGQVGWEGLS